MRRKWKLLLAAACCAPLLMQSVSARRYDYILDGGKRLPVTVGYRFVSAVTEIPAPQRYLKKPSGLFIDGRDHLYIADTGNNRVVELDAAARFVREYTLADAETPLSGPEGVYADDKQSLYIADTGNHRVVHVSAAGEWIEDFTAPQSTLFDRESYGFSPTKVMLDHFGYLCILNGNDYHGVIKLDAYNRFIGYFGANKVETTLSDYIIRYFGTEEQKEQYHKRQPPYISGMAVDGAGYIYTSNILVKDQELKKLDQSGVNVLPVKGSFAETDYTGTGVFADLHVSEDGIMTAADNAMKRIYQFDADGNMLCAFGGPGSLMGMFGNPAAVSRDSRGNVYVLDKDYGNLQIFQRTEFMENVHRTLSLYREGDYKACGESLRQVLQADSTYLPAYHIQGRLRYKAGDYPGAMEAFRLVDDMENYSRAFDKQRQILFRQYFLPVLGVSVLFLLLAVFGVSRTRRRARRKILDGMVNRDV